VSRRELFGSLCAMAFLVNLSRVIFAPLVQSLGSGAVGTAVTRGVPYTTAFQTLAVVVGGVTVVLAALSLTDRLPAGRTPPDSP